MLRVKKFLVFWLPPLLWMALIFFLSSFHKLQAFPIGWQDFITRKLAHFLEYAILYILFYRAFKNSTKLSFKKCLILAFFVTITYAISDECHQTKVVGRTGRFFDVSIDSCGAFFGMIFSGKIVNLLPEKFQKIINLPGSSIHIDPGS